MKKNSLILSLLLLFTLNFNALTAQHAFYIQDFDFVNPNATVADELEFYMLLNLECDNYQIDYNPRVSIQGSTINIDIHTHSDPNCISNPRQISLFDVLQLTDAGIYQVYANAYVDGVLVNSIMSVYEFRSAAAPLIQGIRSNAPICIGEDVQIEVNATNTVSYQWQHLTPRGWANLPNDNFTHFGTQGSTLHILNPDMTNNQSKYRCVVTGTGGNKDTSSAVTVTINTLPELELFASKDLFCEGSSSNLFSSSTSAITNYQWLHNDEPIAHAQEATLSVREGGRYSLHVTDVNGCEQVFSKRLKTKSCTTVFSNESLKSNNLVVFPNPVQDQLHLKSADLLGARIVLLNQHGQVLKELTANSTELTLLLEEFTAGLYLLQVIQNEEVQTLKVVKS